LRHAYWVTSLHHDPSDAEARPRFGSQSISLTWALLLVAIALLLGQAVVGFVMGRNGIPELALAVATALLVASAVLNARASGIELARRQAEAQAFSRMLQALSRSVSPAAVLDAIVYEIGSATEADHVAVVQTRPGSSVLDVTLASMLPGGQTTTGVIPVRQLGPAVSQRLKAVPAVSAAMTLGPAEGNPPADRDSSALRRSSPAPQPRPGFLDYFWPRGNSSAPPRPEPAYSHEAREIADQIALRLRDEYGLRNMLSAPLVEDRSVVGAIVLSRRTGLAWADSAVRLLNGAAGETAAALARVYSHQAAEALARTDQLTRLPNRRYFDEYSTLLASRRRASDRVAILLVDVDHFKRLNDMYGHQIGDVVLRSIANAIQTAVRDDDLPARYGGEEFIVLLRNPGPGVAMEVGERVRKTVREMDLVDDGVTDRVTVSVGVAGGYSAGEPITDIVERADRALYAAKRAGRDRVIEDQG
jgi:diguanylate cyclase (GGDEF)-like protein